jgi:hypothetical protein
MGERLGLNRERFQQRGRPTHQKAQGFVKLLLNYPVDWLRSARVFLRKTRKSWRVRASPLPPFRLDGFVVKLPVSAGLSP